MRRRWPLALIVFLLLVPQLLVLMSSVESSSGEVAQGLETEMPEPQWPMAFGDARHSCLSPFEEASGNGTVRWISATGRKSNSVFLIPAPQPIIDQNGNIYISSYDGHVYAYDNRGSSLWSTSTNLTRDQTGGPRSPAIDEDGNLYIPKRYETLWKTGSSSWTLVYYGIEKWNSKKEYQWNFTVPNGFDEISAVTIADDGRILFTAKQFTYNVFTPKEKLHVYSLSPDGTLIWESVFEGSVESTPAISSRGTVYVGTNAGLEAILHNGSTDWSFSTSAPVDSPPSIGADGTIYFGCKDSLAYALNPNGTLKWSFDTRGQVNAPVALGKNGIIMVGSGDGHVYALDHNGTELWRYQTGGLVEGITIDSVGHALISSRKAPLVSLDQDGNLLWNLTLDDFRYSPPVIDDEGTIYLYGDEFRLYSLGARVPSPPQGVTAFKAFNGVEVTWALPSNPGSSPILGMYIYRGVNVTSPITLENINEKMELLSVLSPNQTEFLDEGAEWDMDYQYVLVAFNEVGISDVSNISTTQGKGTFIYFHDGSGYSDIFLGTILFFTSVLGVLFASAVFRTIRDEINFIEVLRRPFRLVKGMLADPSKTFEAARENTLGEALLYFIAWTVIFIAGSVALTELFGVEGGVYPILENLGDGSILGTVFALMILLFLVVFLMIVVVWLINFACALFGARNGYDETAKSVIYGSTPGYILGWLPFLFIIPLAWSIVNQGIGFKVLHGLTTKRAIGSVILSIIMISILFFVIYSVFF